MSDDKPMTVKERMAALARASSGGNSAPAPGPPKMGGATAPGTSVAERLSKLRYGGTSSPVPGSPKRSGSMADRSNSPVKASSPGRSQGPSTNRSSVADRIARLSSAGSSASSIPQSPSRPPQASTSPGRFGRTTSGSSDRGVVAEGKLAGGGSGSGSASASAVDRTSEPSETVKDTSSGEASGVTDEEASTATGARPRRVLSGKVSAGLAARINAMSSDASSTAGDQEPPPPPALETSGSNRSSAKMSPGLAARMQALGTPPHGSSGASLSPGRGGDNGGGTPPGGAAGRAQRMGGVGLPGMGMGIPMPGAMPAGGLAELKRRKRETEGEASGAAGQEDSVCPASSSSSEPVIEQKPGELQHANLSRATIPQKRRPRRAARPFKASAAAAPPTAGSSATPAPRSDEVDKAVVTDAEPSIASEVEQSAESPSRLEVKAVADGGGATESASEGMSQASPGPAKEETTDDAENKMTSMLRAASLDAAEDKENDDEWE